jgi:hypothetical protein
VQRACRCEGSLTRVLNDYRGIGGDQLVDLDLAVGKPSAHMFARGEYESVRAEATYVIVLAGHEDRRVERVAFSNDRFLIVEKQGAAARDAEETDPRS